MTIPDIASLIKDIFIAGAAATTAVVAVKGLKSWSSELKGKADFEIARNLIRSTYKLRDEISASRSPFIQANEFPEDYYNLGTKTTDKKQADAWSYVYTNRWKPIWAALQEFDANSLEAEALWGKTIKEKTEEFRSCVRDLRLAMDAVVSDKLSGGEDFKSSKEFGIKMGKITAGQGRDDTNEFSKSISVAVDAIEKQILPHLKRS